MTGETGLGAQSEILVSTRERNVFTLLMMSIRVLQALSCGTVGGTELMVHHLVRGLDRSQFACAISFLDGFGPITRDFEELQIPVRDLSGPGGPLGAARRFAALLNNTRFHIIHLYGFRMSLLGRVAARFVSPRPLIVHGIRGLHITEGEETDRLTTQVALAVERLGTPLVDAYIANSHGAVSFLTSRGIPAKKFVVIPNGIELTTCSASDRQPRTQIPTIICVANFRPRKRQHDLLESVAILRKQGVQVRCQLVGDGVTRPEVEAFARQRDLTSSVEFLGSRTHPRYRNYCNPLISLSCRPCGKVCRGV